MRLFKKPFRWAFIYSTVLFLSVAFVLLDTFVIPHVDTPAVSNTSVITSTDINTKTSVVQTSDENTSAASNNETVTDTTDSTEESNVVITDTSYSDENIQITIETVYVYNTAVYIADIQVSDVSYLKTAFANDIYGRNIKDTTSDIAEDNDAIFAINGDYYGFRNYGYVIRNGVLYRDTSGSGEDLFIDYEGNFSIINEQDISAQSLLSAGAWQVLSFGPALINDGEITVTSNSEVGQSMSSNPRTAIGQVSELHYIVIVADGRTKASAGLSLLELAELFAERGCTVAYNLDGGGSATMWFNGEVVNTPTDGRTYGERSVSDIVYFS